MNSYIHHFDKHEWFIIIAVCIGYLVVYFLPSRFSKQNSAVFLLCGVFFGFFFDHSLSVLPVNFYDIGDSPRFEFMDFVSQCMYAPYSYLFFYLYDRLRVIPRYSPIYILVWVFVSVLIEKIAGWVGVYHYNHGYNIYYSFTIYFAVLPIWVFLYYLIKAYGERHF